MNAQIEALAQIKNSKLAILRAAMLYELMRRVYIEPQELASQNFTEAELRLPDDEGRYLRQVLRMQPGDALELFDGQGHVAQAQISSLLKREITCKINKIHTQTQPANPLTHIGLALIKNDALDLALRMLCEIGVQRIQLVHCEHSVTKWKNAPQKSMQRLQRVAMAALRQSGRNWMPEILSPIELADWNASCAPGPRYFGDLGENPANDEDDEDGEDGVIKMTAAEAYSFAIGPEGGFSEAERQILLKQGVQPVRLGPHILRADTAAIVAATWVQTQLGLWGSDPDT